MLLVVEGRHFPRKLWRPQLGIGENLELEVVLIITTVPTGHGRREAPVRGRAREVSTKPQIDGREEQVPPEPVVTPLLQDTLLSVLSVLKGFSQGGCTTSSLDNSRTRQGAQTKEQQQLWTWNPSFLPRT